MPLNLAQRLKDLADHVAKDMELLQQYEEELRYEADPRRRSLYQREIERQQAAISRYQQEYEQLEQQLHQKPLQDRETAATDLNRLQGWFGQVANNPIVQQPSSSHSTPEEPAQQSNLDSKVQEAAAAYDLPADWLPSLSQNDVQVPQSNLVKLTGQEDNSAISHLLKALTDPELEIRQSAVGVLQKRGTTILPILVEALEGADNPLRRQIVYALGEIGDEQAVPALCKTLLEDPVAEIRGSAARALGKLSDSGLAPV